MDAGGLSRPYLRVLAVGVGTVFTPIALLMSYGLVAALVQGLLEVFGLIPVKPYDTPLDQLALVGIYAFVGSGIAALLCAALALPMILLWIPIFGRLRRGGYETRHAAILTAGALSCAANLVGIGFLAIVQERWQLILASPLVLAPTGCAMILARALFSDQSGRGAQ